jgi:hypothetical protein
MKPRPATEGSYPLGSPDERLPVASHGAYSPLVKEILFYPGRSDDPVDETARPGGFA